jgi:hypothetical protein
MRSYSSKEAAMEVARVVSFEGVGKERVEEMRREMSDMTPVAARYEH